MGIKDGQIVDGGHEAAGTQIENPHDVASRANGFFQQIARDASKAFCLVDVDYVLYSQFALRNRDQRERNENAPLAVERRVTKEGGEKNEDGGLVMTNTEVWRYSFVTDDKMLFEQVMDPNYVERVVSSAEQH